MMFGDKAPCADIVGQFDEAAPRLRHKLRVSLRCGDEDFEGARFVPVDALVVGARQVFAEGEINDNSRLHHTTIAGSSSTARISAR